MNKKIIALGDLKELRERYQKEGKTVVFTNGCFDVLHSGHVHLFRKAKDCGDVLIVAVNDDLSVRALKGPDRPVFPLEERLEVLEAIESIDHLISFSQPTPQELIRVLLPDVLVKGGDWKPDEVVGREEVEGAGGRVVIIPYLSGRSSSEILDKIMTKL